MKETGTADLPRMILDDPETGLRWAMREHAAMVRGALRRILPGRERDVEERNVWRMAACGKQVQVVDKNTRELAVLAEWTVTLPE